ncbi:hypothetical protein [Nocardioides dongkuii]|uniref:hypothetical protein n=1 Tax=Nocardioides dongkuii TaxID=2760089 RepID=UPI0015F98F45|nr:hypothetical protein [Nocardioides dongkuii]
MSRRRVFVHIGAPKTGTTYLQDRLWLNARSLAQHDVHFPTRSPFVDPALFHFRAALDLLGEDWGGPPGHAVGAWDALVRRVRRRSGTVVISHEILAPATQDKIARLKRDLSDSDLHVVYSARDLGRQVPAAWQESIKQGRKWSYRHYVRRLQRGDPWFSRAFDLPSVLSSWSAGLRPENVHVVTVPRRTPAPAPGDDLWGRFCTALGIDPAWGPVDSARTNQSLGSAEVQLLRRLNRRMDRKTRREASYDALIRELLAHHELAGRSSTPVRLPPAMHPWAAEQAERWIEWVQASGVHVVGDLEDLRPEPPDPDVRWANPDKVRAKAQLSAAIDALAAMTREAARRTDPDQQLVAKVRIQAKRLREQ